MVNGQGIDSIVLLLLLLLFAAAAAATARCAVEFGRAGPTADRRNQRILLYESVPIPIWNFGDPNMLI